MNDTNPPISSRVYTVEGFAREFLHELNFGQGVDLDRASVNDKYLALSRTVRHYLATRWLEALRNQYRDQAKVVAYLSAEYLLGPQLDNSMLAADLEDIATRALDELGVNLEELRAMEIEPGLGNGGLGRLAACFIDSLATMDIPSIGYGIRYEYGIFRQTFQGGKQVEKPDDWLRLGSPWEIAHPENAVEVHFAGRTEPALHGAEGARAWLPGWHVMAVPYNYLVPGYRNGRVNTLRLWSARATRGFDLQNFNSGEYEEAVRARTYAENISKVLYPEDSTPQGKELRLQQQYFFVAASLRDFLQNVLPKDFDLKNLPDRITWQLNDTHPVIAVPEMMRLLVDERGWDWADAWAVCQKIFAYTCHTLLPEALEVWPVDLLGKLLPRHLEIIYRINDEFLEEVAARYPGDTLRMRRMSIVADQPVRAIRMAHLATVASFKVNGVAELHSQLLAEKVLRCFAQMWPEKFTNVTNGV
ncbi:MAG: glycogen/starch/alpha-glucan family phosphorylase, partial [Demequina sp.]|nr:glycogen/starch/alpha-glucan family phosphorylase [Demequina sp.]